MECSIKKLLLPVLLTGSLSVFLLFGFAEIEGEGQHIRISATDKKGTIRIGQTFYSHYDNLNRIDVMFSSSAKDSQKVSFYVKEFDQPLELCEPVQQQIKTGFMMFNLSQEKNIGQTFTAHCPGLNALHVFISVPRFPDAGNVILRLKTTPKAESDIVRIVKEVAHLQNNAYNSFAFPLIPDSQGKQYYFLLESEGIGPEFPLKIPYTQDETYPGGKGYLNDTPMAGDLVFKKNYWSSLEEKETLIQVTTAISKSLTEEYRTFRFAPIRHSKGKYYYFFLEFQGNTLAPWEVESDLYQQGTKIVDHFPIQGDLTFRALYKVKAIKAIQVLLERVSKNKPGLFSKRFLYAAVFLGYILVFTLFFWQLIR